jgi:hypothetical protein
MKVEYIDGDSKNGIKYDWGLIHEEYRKLQVPSIYYDPLKMPIPKTKWNIIMSERSRGKTSEILLLGMVMNKLYGTHIQYLRSREDMIVKKNSEDLFTVLIRAGYVEKLTNGQYNNIVYRSRRWYYQKIDEDGNEIERAPEQFCTMLSIDRAEIYKSAYNAPLGDYIVFDEFIERAFYPDLFISFVDLVKTIARDRLSVVLILLSNTIDRNAIILKDLMITEAIEDMKQGDAKVIVTPKGTKIYVEIMEKLQKKASNKRNRVNTEYYGFDNNRLSGITGSDTWAVDSYPHPPKKFKIIQKNHYLELNGKLVNMEICQTLPPDDDSDADYYEDQIFINLHPATKTYEDSVIYSIESNVYDSRYRYKFGMMQFDQWLWKKYNANLFTYSDNTTGALVDKYIQIAKKL